MTTLFSSKKHELSPESKKLLEGYMAGAVKEIGFARKKDAEEIATYYANDFYKAGKAEGVSKADVKAMEKQVSKELKQYGLRERINYATDGRAIKENPTSTIVQGAFAATMMAMSVGAAAADGEMGLASAFMTIGLAGAAANAALYYAGTSYNKEQERKIDEYTELKHAQLALKQLKREFSAAEHAKYKEEVAGLFAAGYGQPSGGLIQNPVQMAKLKNQGR